MRGGQAGEEEKMGLEPKGGEGDFLLLLAFQLPVARVAPVWRGPRNVTWQPSSVAELQISVVIIIILYSVDQSSPASSQVP